MGALILIHEIRERSLEVGCYRILRHLLELGDICIIFGMVDIEVLPKIGD